MRRVPLTRSLAVSLRQARFAHAHADRFEVWLFTGVSPACAVCVTEDRIADEREKPSGGGRWRREGC